MYKLHLSIFLLLGITLNVLGQSSESLEFDEAKPTSDPVYRPFKHTRLINGHSVTLLDKGEADILIRHRFGYLSNGAYELWGLDEAHVRIAVEYAPTKNLNVGVGRSSPLKTFDGYVKYRLTTQDDLANKWFTAVWLSTASVSSELAYRSPKPDGEDLIENSRYTHQLLLARKFSDKFGLQIDPGVVHRNKVQAGTGNNVTPFLNVGLRWGINSNVDLIAEYNHLFYNEKPIANHEQTMALGIDVEVGGHVFSLHFTNAIITSDADFILNTTGRPDKFNFRPGFNLSRRVKVTD